MYQVSSKNNKDKGKNERNFENDSVVHKKANN